MSQPNIPEVPEQEQVPASISAAAHAYQVAMQQQAATPPVVMIPAPQAQAQAQAPATDCTKDVVMTDGTPDRPAVSLRASLHAKIEY
jgi:COMPASS component SDC1